jgi:hypothetical protein
MDIIEKLTFVRDTLNNISLTPPNKTFNEYKCLINTQEECYKMLEDVLKELQNDININKWIIQDVKIKII